MPYEQLIELILAVAITHDEKDEDRPLKLWHWASLMTVCMGSLTVLAAREPASVPQSQEVVWQTDYSSAQDAARKSGKLLFVVFRCER